MRLPISWLRDYVAVEMPLDDLAERLAVATCEVERISWRGVPDRDGNLGLFRVGRVVEAAKHPNADRLQLCRVDVGEAEPRQIVCGAWNFGAGATVAVALPGALLPDGLRLERRELRGALSDGMILSERELELSTEHAGILVLPDGHEPGTPLGEVFALGEPVLEVETTGNRPDLLSIYGIAREVAALYDLELGAPPGREPEREGDEPVDVRVEDEHGCPRYLARVFRDVTIGDSPPWLKARLTAAGMRPISNVVDVTNYAMLALGNPLHAFDLAKLAERRVVVRRAGGGEEVATLDGTRRALDARDLVIADARRAVAIAGIMGSLDSEVDEGTTDVLLEAANFEPVGILHTSERLSLRTEGSNRWEKGVDPHLADQAATLATGLLVELAGARWVGATDASAPLPRRPVVRLRPERTDAIVGIGTAPGEQRRILSRLGFEVADDWTVTVPTWRARDVTREIDLVEEVARFHLGEVPATLPQRRAMFGRPTKEQRLRRVVEDVLVGCGFNEAYTPSLGRRGEGEVVLAEPLTPEHAALRASLRHGLLEAARHNLDSGNERVSLFEIARVYLPSGEPLPEERWRVGGITDSGYGRAKGAVETLCGALRIDARFRRAAEPFLHPGKAAAIDAGWVGELHPAVAEGAWGAFELDLATLLAGVRERVRYEDVITFPAVKQDLAFAVPEQVLAGELVEAMREAVGPELRDARVFDVYRGAQVGEGRKSIAVAVAFQSPERTLSDDDAARLRGRIVEALAARFGAELRGQ